MKETINIYCDESCHLEHECEKVCENKGGLKCKIRSAKAKRTLYSFNTYKHEALVTELVQIYINLMKLNYCY